MRGSSHVDARTHDPAALANRLQCQRHQRTSGREDDSGIEWLGRHLIRATGPCRAEAACESLRGGNSRSGKSEYGSSLPLGDLRDDVSRSAEAIKSELFTGPCDHQRTPADQSCAKQRGKCHVISSLTEWKREPRIGNRRRRETTVTREAGEDRVITEIFLIPDAIRTHAAGMAKPRNTDSLANTESLNTRSKRVDPANNFMARDDRNLRVWQFAIDDVQIGAANATNGHLHADLSVSWLPIR